MKRGEEGESSEGDRHVLHYQFTYGDGDRHRVSISPYVHAKHLQVCFVSSFFVEWAFVGQGDDGEAS